MSAPEEAMGDVTTAPAPAKAASAPAAGPDKRAQAEVLLQDILKLMEFPARLDFQAMPDGGIGVAVHFEGELPGITPGKRSYLVDCLQFLLNKVVNRPNTERRWVTLGVNGFPEPRAPQGQRGGAAPGAAARGASPGVEGVVGGASVAGAAAAPAPAAAKPSAPSPAAPSPSAPRAGKAHGKHGRDARVEGAKDAQRGGGSHAEARHEKARPAEADEAAREVAEDPALTKAVTALAEKAARLGRPYAVLLLSADDRARFLRAAGAAKGVRVKAEGEAHLRRVAIVPEKPVPMPKRQTMPDYDEEE